MIKNNLKIKNFLYKGCTLSVALFLCVELHANSTDRTLIKAQEMLLNKNRKEAIVLLVGEIKKSHSSHVAVKKLKNVLHRTATMFYSEKAMKKYNLAKSVIYSDSNLTSLTLQDALELEPFNENLIALLVANQIYQGQCSKAESRLLEGLKLNPYSEIYNLLQKNVLVCLEKYDEVIKTTNSVESLKYLGAYIHAMAIYSLKVNDKAKIKYYLKELDKKGVESPVINILRWKANILIDDPLQKLKEYVALCSATKLHKKYENLFFYCDFVALAKEGINQLEEEKTNEAI